MMDTDKSPKARQYNRSLGANILDTLSRNVAGSIYGAVIELIANSYDADAKNVWIEHSAEEDALILRDDGLGMSPDELENFYRVGDSVKSLERTQGGRIPLGSFGIATLGLRMIAKEYSLQTVNGDTCTVVQERFTKKLNLEDHVNAQIIPAQGEPQGTTISLRNLLAKGKDFSIKELTNRIAWTLPVESNTTNSFSVYVNNEPIKSKPIENAAKFLVDERGEQMGAVKGVVYLTKTPVKESGIYIKVNGRTIGDPKGFINLTAIKSGTAARIVGIIHADGMASVIRTDRAGF